MKIELKEKSKQMDIKEVVNRFLLNSKSFLFDYPYKNMKEAIWEREGKELVTMLSLCTNEYVSVCCKYDVYTKYISSSPNDEGMLEWLREGGKLRNKDLVDYKVFSICYKCRQWSGLLKDNFFTFSHESDMV